MPRTFSLPYRQIHLDFHTSPLIKDVGVDFDARRFAAVLKAAHVNSVTVFAKCHHGHLYYNTKRPERHPGLKRGLDLLGLQIKALHRQGIRAPIYISVNCDEYAAEHFPQWITRQPDGRPAGRGPLSGVGFAHVDMGTPYQEYVADQLREILERFHPVDGIFFDMCWDQASVSNYSIAGMLARGLDPEIEAHRYRYAQAVSLDYMKRFHRMVKASSPQASVYFNSRSLSQLPGDVPYLEQVEIEALPTGGGPWGYMFFPKNVRWARTFPRPYMGMTARFHKGWGDFGSLKPYAALEYETSQMMAHGARCSVGDQLHPRGALDGAVYDLIGRAYGRVEEREPWLHDAAPVTQIGVFQLPGGPQHTTQKITGTDEGVTRMLTQLRHQFDVVASDGAWEKYELLILPDAVAVDAALRRRLTAYVRQGGKLLLSGTSGLDREGGTEVFGAMGVRPSGFSPFATTYLRFGPEINRDVPATDHVMYERGVRIRAIAGTRVLARVVEPYFDRSWRHFSSHSQTPSAYLSRYAAATLRGNVAYVAYPVFAAFATHGNIPYRLMVRNILDLLLPDPLLRLDAPTRTEATVMRQRGRTIVHLLHYSPERRTPSLDIVEDIVALFGVPLSLKLGRKPRRVYLAPQGEDIPFTYLGGRVNLLVPEIHGHAMVVFE